MTALGAGVGDGGAGVGEAGAGVGDGGSGVGEGGAGVGEGGSGVAVAGRGVADGAAAGFWAVGADVAAGVASGGTTPWRLRVASP